MTDKVIKLYYSSVTGNSNMRKHQQHIEDVLSSRSVIFEKIDISDPLNEKQKQYMRENAYPAKDGKTPLPPQLFYDEEYLGDYEKFAEALEDERIDQFLKLAVKTEVSHAEVSITGEEGEQKEDEEKLKADEDEKESNEKDKTIEEVAEDDMKKQQAEQKLEEGEKQMVIKDEKESNEKDKTLEEAAEDDMIKKKTEEKLEESEKQRDNKDEKDGVIEDSKPSEDNKETIVNKEDIKPIEVEKDKPLVFKRVKDYDDEETDPWGDLASNDSKADENKEEKKVEEIVNGKKKEESKMEPRHDKNVEEPTPEEDLKKPLVFRRMRDYDEEETDPWADISSEDKKIEESKDNEVKPLDIKPQDLSDKSKDDTNKEKKHDITAENEQKKEVAQSEVKNNEEFLYEDDWKKPILFKRKKDYDEDNENVDPWAEITSEDTKGKDKDIEPEKNDEEGKINKSITLDLSKTKEVNDDKTTVVKLNEKSDKNTEEIVAEEDSRKPLVFRKRNPDKDDDKADLWADITEKDTKPKESNEAVVKEEENKIIENKQSESDSLKMVKDSTNSEVKTTEKVKETLKDSKNDVPNVVSEMDRLLVDEAIKKKNEMENAQVDLLEKIKEEVKEDTGKKELGKSELTSESVAAEEMPKHLSTEELKTDKSHEKVNSKELIKEETKTEESIKERTKTEEPIKKENVPEDSVKKEVKSVEPVKEVTAAEDDLKKPLVFRRQKDYEEEEQDFWTSLGKSDD